jgi:hypothetical protein
MKAEGRAKHWGEVAKYRCLGWQKVEKRKLGKERRKESVKKAGCSMDEFYAFPRQRWESKTNSTLFYVRTVEGNITKKC